MRTLIALCLVASFAGCAGPDLPAPDERRAFADIVDHHGVPAAAEDWSLVPFCDRGAWFGFALPTPEQSGASGGFAGPFLMTGGRWLSPGLARLDLPGADLVRAVGLPGSLELVWRAGDLDLTQSLWFADSGTALIRSCLRNRGATATDLRPAWTGRIFPGAATLSADDDGILARTTDGTRVRIAVIAPVREAMIQGTAYRLELADSPTVAPGDSIVIQLAVTMAAPGDSLPDPTMNLMAADLKRARNGTRWNNYLSAVAGDRSTDDPVRILAVKGVETLINNWRGPAGRLGHGGLFPSSNVWYFNGFWAWDSWKHAVGLALFAPSIAADQLRLMFDHQDDQGMIADVVYLDPAEDNWRDTKPPLAGWALETVFAASGDLDLVRDLYPRLVAYHRFWYAHRDHDRDGLCEFGSTDGTIVAARWESGMDNAVRFDGTRMRQNGPRAWSMDQESVDLNSYLYREKLALERLAGALGRMDDAARWADEATELRDLIRRTMFDESTGWFYDIGIDGGAFIPVRGPEGWTPLWTGVASAAQAGRVRETMLDSTHFHTHVPFPTVSRADPGFSEGYWRGLVWLDQVYFAIDGLRTYGFEDDADALTRRLIANLEGAAEPGAPLRENYHPLTGAGHNVKHFSWTAAHLLLLTRDLR